MKYQLIRISEILLSWARFTKSTLHGKIKSIRANLLVDQWTLEDLELVKATFWNMVLESSDKRLYEDLKDFFNDQDHSSDPTSMTSMS